MKSALDLDDLERRIKTQSTGMSKAEAFRLIAIARAAQPFIHLAEARFAVFGHSSLNSYWTPVVSGASGTQTAQLTKEDWDALLEADRKAVGNEKG